MNQVLNTGVVFANLFSKTIKDLMNSAFKMNLVEEHLSTQDEKNYPSFVTGVMILKGSTEIVFTLTLSKMAAASIVVSLLGVKYTELVDTDVYDAVMEVTNMASGRIKSAIFSIGENCELTTPFVFVGQNHYIPPNTRPIGLVKKFKEKNFEMLAGIYFL